MESQICLITAQINLNWDKMGPSKILCLGTERKVKHLDDND